ncbi:MAG: hypothetical protein IJ285_05905, partial [Clostridia bacterium]|nr:hypothetical protein [Clostridia bacterium]
WSPGSITMEFADNVTFTDNHFLGLAGIAVDALNGVVNSNIVGNAFSDIGEAAVSMGNMNHLTGHIDENGVEQFSGGNGIGEDGISDAPPDGNLDVCVSNLLGTTWDTSSIAPTAQGSDVARMEADTYHLVKQTASTNGGQLSSPSWETDYTYSSSHTWRSAYDAVEKGEKSWVKLDFQKPYTISRVALMFCTSVISKEERKGYEILLSNDKFFNEGNYVVAATQTLTAKALQEYTINADGKYRYLMVRTTDATPFALNRICVFSSDKKAYETFVRCKNNKINNNYITRTGTELQRSGGIVMYYVEDVEVKHNHLYDLNYSGIEAGWGWSNERYGTYNVDIDNNYIEHTVKKAMDGGAIYTLSAMPDSSVSWNHVIDTGVGIHALYTDSGSRFIDWVDNVAEDQRGGYTPYNNTIIENVFKGYATHSRNTLSSTAKADNDITDMELYSAGQPERCAYKIISESGLEPEYEYLLDIPAKGQAIEELEELVDYIHNFDYWPGLSVHYTDADEEAENTLSLGKYGSGLGMYKPEMKPYMEEELSYWDAQNNNIKLKSLMRIKQAMRNVKASMQRFSVDDTIALFEGQIEKVEKGFADGGSESDFGLTTKAKLAEAKTKLADLKAKAELISDGGMEYDVLVALESAYNDFKAACNNAEIAGVYSKDALSAEIDSEKCTVKLVYPYGTDLSTVNLKLFAGLGSEITATIGNTVSLTQALTVPVRAVSSGKVKNWTVSATQKVSADTGANGDGFIIPTRYKNRIAATQNNSVILRGNPYAYMTDSYSVYDNGSRLKIKPVTPNAEYEFAMVFGAGNINRFDVDGKSADSNHFQLIFNEEGTELYAVESGNRKLIAQSLKKIIPNGENTLLYTIKDNKIDVTLNKETIFSEVTQYTPGGTNMGIYSPKICVEVFNDFEESEIINPVSAVTPSYGATNVTNVKNADNGNYVNLIRIEFGEKMNTATLNQDSIVVTRGDTVVGYTPVINDGTVYAIDPADLVNEKVKGGSARGAYTGVSWNEFINQPYTVTMKNTVRLKNGAPATAEDLAIMSFKSLYFADVPYAEGKCIENVGTSASISAVATSGLNKEPQTLLTNPDLPYNDGGAYSVLNPGKNLTELGTITLDKAYDVAGVMVRTRFGFSSAPSWNGVTFKAGNTKEDAVALLYTGFGGNNDTALNNSCVLSNSVAGFDSAINGQNIYMDMEAAQLFFPNKIWIFAYTDDYIKTPAFGYRDFEVSGTLKDGFSAEVETDGAEPGLVAAIYDSTGRLIDAGLGVWDSTAQKSVVSISGNNMAVSLRVFLLDSVTKMMPVAETLTENDLVQTK